MYVLGSFFFNVQSVQISILIYFVQPSLWHRCLLYTLPTSPMRNTLPPSLTPNKVILDSFAVVLANKDCWYLRKCLVHCPLFLPLSPSFFLSSNLLPFSPQNPFLLPSINLLYSFLTGEILEVFHISYLWNPFHIFVLFLLLFY